MVQRPKDWSPEEEKRFLMWYRRWANFLGLDRNPDAPEHYYDYRGAYRVGAEPSQEEGWHWPSQFKLPGHPRRYIKGVDTITGRKVK